MYILSGDSELTNCDPSKAEHPFPHKVMDQIRYKGRNFIEDIEESIIITAINTLLQSYCATSTLPQLHCI